jgi:CRISPR type III-B/RAMP module RAMP protein Cmr6
MAEPEERFTLAGTKLPRQKGLPPTLLFHRWQRYDCFWPDSFIAERNKVQNLTPFKRDFTGLRFLERVAKEAQELMQERYSAWNKRYTDALDSPGLKIEPVIRATTLWRLVVGWGTNPAFETGITLDHFLGFPYIPGSAVKGLLHRVAEQELLEERDGAAIPTAPATPPAEPPSSLTNALVRSLRIRALFGSLHLRSQKGGHEAPFDRLTAWRNLLPEPDSESAAWTEIRSQLARLCSEAPAGGMVACFDAVPDAKTFDAGQRPVLKPDVLTPHLGDSPNPILFLAVRDGVTFELRYRLASEPRDSDERERTSDLGGIDRDTVAAELQRWLVRGLAELGLGGKTSAGYGYFLPEGARLSRPKLLEESPVPAKPKEELPEPERQARQVLPEEISGDQAVAALDKALTHSDPKVRAAVAARFKELFPETLEKWRASKKAATKRRVEAIDGLLGEGEESEL